MHSGAECSKLYICCLYTVDRKYESVILPLHGVATPFHISTVKVRKGVYFCMHSCIMSKELHSIVNFLIEYQPQ